MILGTVGNLNVFTFTAVRSSSVYLLDVSIRKDLAGEGWVATWEYLPDWVGNGKTIGEALSQLGGALVDLLSVLLAVDPGKSSGVPREMADAVEIPFLLS